MHTETQDILNVYCVNYRGEYYSKEYETIALICIFTRLDKILFAT